MGAAEARRKAPRKGSAAGPSSLPARVPDVSSLLAARYGRPDRCAHEKDPVRNLILTILSQNTTDANRDRAFESLMRRFPTLPRLAAAPPRAVEEAIRVGGLAGAKARAILAALRRLSEERGAYTLDFVADMPLAQARSYLTSFPGVGVKTANVILLFSFRREAFPVDTHVLRVAKRLGLVPQNATLARAALLIEPHVPHGEHAPLHLNMIRLGREICRPKKPRHAECPLLSVCPEGRRSVKPAPSMDGQVPRRSGRPRAAKPGRRERPPGAPRP